MKKITMSLAICILAFSATAQKYMTRTGKVTFFSATKVENIEAVNNETANVMDAANGNIMIQVPIKSFRFEKQLMQEHFNENYMESDKFPRSEFKGKINELSDINFEKDGVYKVSASGKLSMHGVTKDVSIPGTVTVKGNSVTLQSVFHVKPVDYGINIPKLVSEKVAEDIEVTLNSVLTPTGK